MKADLEITLGEVWTQTAVMDLKVRVQEMSKPVFEIYARERMSKRAGVFIQMDEAQFLKFTDGLLEARGVFGSLREAMKDGKLPLPWVVQDPDLKDL